MPVCMPLIRNLTGNTTLNVHYGPEAPADTSKLWVKRDTEAIGASVGVEALPESAIVETLDAVPKSCSAGVATVGEKIYIFGGTVSLVFDTETGTLSTLASLPESRSGAMAAAVGTNVYVMGGVASSYAAHKTIFKYDTETDTFETLSATLSRTVKTASTAVVGTTIYVIAGGQSTNAYASNRILSFDTETNTSTILSSAIPLVSWQTGSGAKFGFSYVGAAAIGTKIYLLGGSAHTNSIDGMNDSTAQSTIYVLDTETDTIEKLDATLPEPNGRVTSAVMDGKICLFGGMSYSGGLIYSSKIYIFDPETQTFTTSHEELPLETWFMGHGVVGANVYLFYSTKNVIKAKFAVSLDKDTAYLKASTTDNVFPMFSGDYPVTLGIKAVYVGSTDDVAEQQEAYLYDETTSEWKPI